ncbi:FAD-binding protein [Oscillibacter sp. GMB15532]|uniref:FAD-binding protein n=1 Tax=Oscillibacter sp. GMB15532 TaxID=3230022 RepID=UPI0034DEFA27
MNATQAGFVNIIGAGLAGLSAAIHLARLEIPCRLISVQPSERAQSVLAEGGINGALDTMGEKDTVEAHCEDTLRAGCYLADPAAVRGLAEHAPEIIRFLDGIGVPFNRKDGTIQLRNFGGQKKKRTAYARSSTGKVLMSALIDECRKYESRGLVARLSHHAFSALLFSGVEELACAGVRVEDVYTGKSIDCTGAVIFCFGGLNGFFPGMTTGTTANSGDAAAQAFAQGVRFGNLEMIQYHPTTIGISGKRCLISEAARGEGGRLYTLRNGKPWYFMEEKYPELGNLMPRDVISREMYFVLRDPDCGGQVFLDLRELSGEIWKQRLPDLRAEVKHYLGLDPAKAPIPVEPGIHYFMGGIDVDEFHRTNVGNLYAAGECCCQYHGANRLGGNSMLGALYGGQAAAEHLAGHLPGMLAPLPAPQADNDCADPKMILQISEILLSALGIARDGNTLQSAQEQLEDLLGCTRNEREHSRIYLALAIIRSAAFREESRGAHFRVDFPETNEEYRRQTVAHFDGQVKMAYRASLETTP